jgi:Protein of unknown function (DUF2948)
MTQLKLAGLDTEDLDIISAHVQDAVVKLADIRWLSGDKCFVLVMNRFARDGEADARAGTFERRRAALHFNQVTAVRSTGIARDNKDAVMALLAVRFDEAEAPAGQITLVFAGGGALQLDVDCIEAQLTDLGAAWATENKPEHDLDDA